MPLPRLQLDALVLGLPWQRLGEAGVGHDRQAHARAGRAQAAEVRGHLRALQRRTAQLLEEALDEDQAALASEIEQLDVGSKPAQEPQKPSRQVLPPQLPRREICHEPLSSACGCGCAMKRIGEDVAEKLDYRPGVFMVERHVRGKWVCSYCETRVHAPPAPHIIDKGLPTPGLLAQVLVAKYLEHQPLYR